MPALNKSISYDDSSLLALGYAFETVLTTLRSNNPLHDWDADVERRTQLANILLELGANGITDPYVLRSRALDRLAPVPQSMSLSARSATQTSFPAKQSWNFGDIARDTPRLILGQAVHDLPIVRRDVRE